MPLKLMYITNRPDIAMIAEHAGVDRIFIDMEYIGKEKRQVGLDSVKNHHTIQNIKDVKSVLTTSTLLVRVNPIHDATDEYSSSKEEIDSAIAAGADILMLPYFKTINEVEEFISYVDKRAKTLLLLETPEAAESVEKIVNVPGIDEIHIGMNDLSIGLGKSFMFELLSDGTIESLCLKIKKSGIPYGFGGVASIGSGLLPAELILREHYRLGSSMVILSRSFCNVNEISDLNTIRKTFEEGVNSIRSYEKTIAYDNQCLEESKKEVIKYVETIVKQIGSKNNG